MQERRVERSAADGRSLVVLTRRATGSAPGARIVYLSGSDGRPVRGSACGTALVIAAASVRPKAIVRATCRSVLRVAEARAGRGVDWP
jgi:hypothetical protein